MIIQPKDATLVIMAAGMGSRFGGLKQIEPVGRHGEIIADYSIFDAKRAGFNKVVFIIKKEMEDIFMERVVNRLSKYIHIDIIFQSIDNLPQGFTVPQGREKPWGTAHAVLCCKGIVDTPFAVINADDFYGFSAFQDIYQFITNSADEHKTGNCVYCMAGYLLKNTVTEAGYVSRGICKIDNATGILHDIEELTHIEKSGQDIRYTADGINFHPLDSNTIVSMNAWGLLPSFFDEVEQHFAFFLNENKHNLLKAEYYLPSVVKSLISEKKATIKVLPSRDMWYGFTYKEDKEIVKNAIDILIQQERYPDPLWQ